MTHTLFIDEKAAHIFLACMPILFPFCLFSWTLGTKGMRMKSEIKKFAWSEDETTLKCTFELSLIPFFQKTPFWSIISPGF
jgi:hypothetical protein